MATLPAIQGVFERLMVHQKVDGYWTEMNEHVQERGGRTLKRSRLCCGSCSAYGTPQCLSLHGITSMAALYVKRVARAAALVQGG